MIAIDHNNAVIPNTSLLQILDELAQGVVGIILRLDIVSDHVVLITLRQWEQSLVIRQSIRMVCRHGEHMSVKWTLRILHLLYFIYCSLIQNIV
ncbi:hypothetical protein D3C77_497220 [compost metagenome]